MVSTLSIKVGSLSQESWPQLLWSDPGASSVLYDGSVPQEFLRHLGVSTCGNASRTKSEGRTGSVPLTACHSSLDLCGPGRRRSHPLTHPRPSASPRLSAATQKNPKQLRRSTRVPGRICHYSQRLFYRMSFANCFGQSRQQWHAMLYMTTEFLLQCLKQCRPISTRHCRRAET